MKNLFIRGPIRIGKSTRLRNIVNDSNLNIVGFSGQRIIDSKNIIKGYQARFMKNQKMPHVDVLHTSDLEDIFIFEKRKNGDILEKIFEDINNALNEESFDLIVLDEVGGFELKSKKAFSLLCDILKRDIPCVGTLKSYVNFNMGIDYEDEYKDFENLIISNGKILDVDKNNLEIIDKELGKLLKFYRKLL